MGRAILVVAALLQLASLGFCEAVDFRPPTLVPVPEKIEFRNDVAVKLNKTTRFEISCPDAAAAPWVEKRLKEWFGFKPTINFHAGETLNSNNPEAYLLKAEPEKISIQANSISGIRWAMYTLRQAAERQSHGRTIKGYWMPAMKIEDSPALAWRGLHLCFFPEQSLSLIEHQIRAAAYYKFNYVVLESWGMFKSKKHPYLAFKDSPFTVKQARRLAELARDLGVTLIPQFNIFGHASGARSSSGKHVTLDYHPEYQVLFEPAGAWNWCLSNPEARTVLLEYIDEMHEAFLRPPFFHVGCDEADLPSCPTCRAVKPYEKLVQEHLLNVYDFMKTRGARIMIWHDMLLRKGDARWRGFYTNGTEDGARILEKLPRDVIICDWFYGDATDKGKNGAGKLKYPTLDYFVSLGFDTLTCPWNNISGIEAQGRYAREKPLYGVLETVWHHYRGGHFARMMQYASCAGWRGKYQPREGFWTEPFAVHWQQVGWDMGVEDYRETGYYDTQVTRDIQY